MWLYASDWVSYYESEQYKAHEAFKGSSTLISFKEISFIIVAISDTGSFNQATHPMPLSPRLLFSDTWHSWYIRDYFKTSTDF